jgi:beta-xylosidase
MRNRGSDYDLLSSGGSFTDGSYAMGYAHALSPTGPFVKPSPEPILNSTADVVGPGGGSVVTGPHGGDWLVYGARAVPGGARTLRIDPLVWDDRHAASRDGARPHHLAAAAPVSRSSSRPAVGLVIGS